MKKCDFCNEEAIRTITSSKGTVSFCSGHRKEGFDKLGFDGFMTGIVEYSPPKPKEFKMSVEVFKCPR